MSTNYYMVKPPCKECGLSHPPIHLGHTAGGWKFGVQGYRGSEDSNNLNRVIPGAEVHSLKDLIQVIKKLEALGWHIEDEYGSNLNLDELKSIIEESRIWRGKPAKCHYMYMFENQDKHGPLTNDIRDDEGWSVCYADFT